MVTTDAREPGSRWPRSTLIPAAPVRVTVATDPASPRLTSGWLGVAADAETVKRLGPEAGGALARALDRRCGLTALTVAPTAAGPGQSTLAWEVP